MMKLFKNIFDRSSTIVELFKFLWVSKNWWMIPFVVVLLLGWLLIVFAQSTPVAPLIYTAF